MRLTTCGCRAEHVKRSHRDWWMRLIPTRRLYHCYACDNNLLIPTLRLEQVQLRSLTKGSGAATS